MYRLAVLALLAVVAVRAELVSVMPGGVQYSVEYLGVDGSDLKFQIYGSQQINCNRENATNDADLGFSVSNHTGLKYNYQYYCSVMEYKRSSSDSWQSASISGDLYDRVFRFPKSNFDQMVSGDVVVNIRFKIAHVKASCVNEKHQYQNHEYWMHNRTVIPDSAIGADFEITYSYIYFMYDGELRRPPTFELVSRMSEHYDGSESYRLTAYFRLKCDGASASYLNTLADDQIQVQFDNVSSNAPVQSGGSGRLGFGRIGEWSDVVQDVADGYAFCDVEFSLPDFDLYRNFFYNYTVLAVYSSDEWGTINSNQEFVTLGSSKTATSQYWIRWSVTENGTVNCIVVNSVHTTVGWVGSAVQNDDTEWTSTTGQSASGSKFVFNPYNSENSRDVPRNIGVEAAVYDDQGGQVRRVHATVLLPPLGDQSDNDREGQEVEDLPQDEELPTPSGGTFEPSESLEQTNELLEGLLEEFKNGRDESLAFYKQFAQFANVTDTSANYSTSVAPSSPDLGEVGGELGAAMGEGLGDGVGYGETLPEGFGNGLGGRLEELKQTAVHDVSLTLDFRPLGSLVPRVDTSSWTVTVHLLPDTSTPFGQGVERVARQYVRPFILYALWFVLAYVCVQDVSKFFGNG